jgi:hypothetical protein
MTGLDDLKDAMHSPPDFEPVPIDLGQVMVSGGRIRRRRRLAVGATSGLAVVVLLVGGSLVAGRAGRSATGAADDGRPAATAEGPKVSIPESVTPPPSAKAGLLGSVEATGQMMGGREMVFSFAAEDPAAPEATLILRLGRRQDNGGVGSDYVTNDLQGARLAEGFHAVQGPTSVDGYVTPTFGYYVGDAKKITARVAGLVTEAHLAGWSENASVQVFWFDAPSQNTVANRPSGLSAYDADGRRLAAGNDTVGAG